MMTMTYAPLRHTLIAAGVKNIEDKLFYQDYLYQLCKHGFHRTAISEDQWEQLCGILGKDRIIYAGNLKYTLRNLAAKQPNDDAAAYDDPSPGGLERGRKRPPPAASSPCPHGSFGPCSVCGDMG